jgi:hypothetical protein
MKHGAQTQISQRQKRSSSDAFSIVTTEITRLLAEGVMPWRAPWDPKLALGATPGLPLRFTGEPYRGANVVLLWAAQIARGYPKRTWLSYRQAIALCGQVRKGEKGVPVIFYGHAKARAEQNAGADDDEARTYRFLKLFYVLNVNPHTHIVVRGRRENGQDLVMPRDFIKHGMRSIARDVATEWLGKRTPEQEREALAREARRPGPTRLDHIIEGQARDGLVRMSDLKAPSRDPDLTRAVKARVQELARMGLAEEGRSGLFQLAPDWRDRLKSLEMHIDIRKNVMRERMEQNLQQRRDIARDISKGMLGR